MFKKSIIRLAVTGAAIFVGLVSSISYSTESAQRGLIIYQANCVQCHGEEGDGNGPESVHLETKPLDFNSSRMAALTDSQIDKAVVEGLSAAPSHSWGNKLSKDDIAAVLGHVKKFQK